MEKRVILVGVIIVVAIITFASADAFSDSRECVDTTPQLYIRGDANHDGVIDIADAVFLLDYLFRGGNNPPCKQQADINDDETIDISDAIYLLRYLFQSGPEPAELNYDHAPLLALSPFVNDEISINLAVPVVIPLYPAFFYEDDATYCYAMAYLMENENPSSFGIEIFSIEAEEGRVLDDLGSYEFILGKDDGLYPGKWMVEIKCYDRTKNEGIDISYLLIEDTRAEVMPDSPQYCLAGKDVCCANENNLNGEPGNRYMCLKKCDYDPETGIDLGRYTPKCEEYLDQTVSPLERGRWSLTSLDDCNKPSSWDLVSHMVIDYCHEATIEKDGTVSCGNICIDAEKELERRKMRSSQASGELFHLRNSNSNPKIQLLSGENKVKCHVKDATMIWGKAPDKLGDEEFKFPDEFKEQLEDQPDLAPGSSLGTGPQKFMVPPLQNIKPEYFGAVRLSINFLVVGAYVGINEKNEEIQDVDTTQCREFQFVLTSNKKEGVIRHWDVYPLPLDDIMKTKTLKMLEEEGLLHNKEEVENQGNKHGYIENGECPEENFGNPEKGCEDDYYYIKNGKREGDSVQFTKEFDSHQIPEKKHNVPLGYFNGMFWYDAPGSFLGLGNIVSLLKTSVETNEPSYTTIADFIAILEDEDAQNRISCTARNIAISIKDGKIKMAGPEDCYCIKWKWEDSKWAEDANSVKKCAGF